MKTFETVSYVRSYGGFDAKLFHASFGGGGVVSYSGGWVRESFEQVRDGGLGVGTELLDGFPGVFLCRGSVSGVEAFKPRGQRLALVHGSGIRAEQEPRDGAHSGDEQRDQQETACIPHPVFMHEAERKARASLRRLLRELMHVISRRVWPRDLTEQRCVLMFGRWCKEDENGAM